MARSIERSKRKISGGLYKKSHKKKRYQLASQPALTILGEKRLKLRRSRAGIKKIINLSTNKANVYNPKTKKYALADILTVVENPSNRNYVRRNIMTKGTIIETNIGKAKITSRPGQEPVINAILI